MNRLRPTWAWARGLCIDLRRFEATSPKFGMGYWMCSDLTSLLSLFYSQLHPPHFELASGIKLDSNLPLQFHPDQGGILVSQWLCFESEPSSGLGTTARSMDVGVDEVVGLVCAPAKPQGPHRRLFCVSRVTGK